MSSTQQNLISKCVKRAGVPGVVAHTFISSIQEAERQEAGGSLGVEAHLIQASQVAQLDCVPETKQNKNQNVLVTTK